MKHSLHLAHVALCAAFLIAVGCGGSTANSAPSSNAVTSRSIGAKRDWVRNECWYAIDPDYLSKPNDATGPAGWTESGFTGVSKGGWNWLTKDASNGALNWCVALYTGNVSYFIPTTNGTLPPGTTASQWAAKLNTDGYGLNYPGRDGNGLTNHGHGCTCLSFVNLVIYRATGGYKWGLSWKDINSSTSATAAAPGDLVFLKRADGTNHIGICVRNYVSGKSGGISVVDSNFTTQRDTEIIRRHEVPTSTITGDKWMVISGSGKWY